MFGYIWVCSVCTHHYRCLKHRSFCVVEMENFFESVLELKSFELCGDHSDGEHMLQQANWEHLQFPML